MGKNHSHKVERQAIRKLINQGLFDEAQEAQAQLDEQEERFLEKEERRTLRRVRKNKNKRDWDDQ